MGHIVAVVNQKGGVGKTTTAVNLASCLSEQGQRTLLVDVDPQGNATSGLGFPLSDQPEGLYSLLFNSEVFAEVSRETSFPNLRLLPSCPDLAGAEVELASDPRRRTLRSCLEAVQSEFDFIILDTPPSLGILTVNSLVAADWLLIPVQCEYYALEGLRQLMRTVNLIRESAQPDLRILGLLRTMHDGRTLLSQQVSTELERHFPDLLFAGIIPRTVRLSEAPSHGVPIIRYDPRSTGALAYRRLAEEVLQRFGMEVPFPTPQPGKGIEAVTHRGRVSPLNDGGLAEEAPTEVATAGLESVVVEDETSGEKPWQNEDSVEDWLL